MKKSLLVVLALTLILGTVSMLLLAAPLPVSAGGMVVNQGFESVLGSEWTVVGSAGRVCTSPVHEGSCAAEITGAGGSLTQVINVLGLARYDCWGWIYANGSAEGRIELSFLDENSTVISATVLSANNTTGYELRTATMRAPYQATQLQIRLVEAGWNGSPVVRFDDIGVNLPFGGCFIATAAYGTPLAEEIEVLRQVRDEHLLTNPVGGLFVSLYYRISPPVADFIEDYPALQAVVRAELLPTVALSRLVVNTTFAQKMAIVGGLALIPLALAVWFRRQARGVNV